jgi:hypothetical protein
LFYLSPITGIKMYATGMYINANLYISFAKYNQNDQAKEVDMGRACITNEKKNEHRILVGKPEGKRPLGTPRRRWMDNVGFVWLMIGTGVGLF